MPSKIPDQTIAQILAETDLYSDKEVAQRWALSTRSIERYRQRLQSDPVLAGIVGEKREKLTAMWVHDATQFLVVALRQLQERCRSAKTKEDAECLRAIADCLQIVGELRVQAEILNQQ